MGDHVKRLINIVEDDDVAALPNVPGKRRADSSFFKSTAMSIPKLRDAIDDKGVILREEEAPHLESTMAADKEMIGIFSLITRGASRGST